MITRRHLIAGAASGSVVLVAGCTGDAPAPSAPTAPLPADATPTVDPNHHQVLTRTPAGDLVLPADPAAALTASRALLAGASAVVVVADASPQATATPTPTAGATATASASPTATATATATADPTASPAPEGDPLTRAAELARALGLPLFLDTPELTAELDRLQTRTVIAYGTPAHAGDREILPAPASAGEVDLPGLPAQPPAAEALAMTVGDVPPTLAAVLAAAGAKDPVALSWPHPGETAASTAAVKAHQGPVIAIGEGFGTDEQFAGQVELTRTATEFTGGGVTPLPGRHMVALYGHPETAALGMMGEQPPAEAVQRLKKLVDEYNEFMPDYEVMGAFEIIASVASASAGADGNYTYETPIAKLLPWIEEAEKNDVYVVLDLQPGRKSFPEQALVYQELLKRPHVGLALDPEWRLKPDQRHLRQIGQVHVDEVNEVGAWLADFVAENKLPPKVLILHQFQTRMIIDRVNLDTSRPEIQYLMHVDGQGGQSAKQDTWNVLKRDLPPRVLLGWKNFEDEDKPMLTVKQTVEQVKPVPHFISYQ